ncbi:MAG: ATP-binding cassette domain-containing protein [Nitrososphaerales archaeon]
MIIELSIANPKIQRQTFKVDREFKTRTKITKRTVAVGQAFGIGVDEEKTFQVFKNFQVEIKPGQVVFITGDSGSGKSTLLKEICSQISASKEEFKGSKLADSASIEESEVIIEGVGKNMNEAISILSMAGLNEAFLMLRKFSELSDGQKYRYRIARMIDSSSDIWAFDEFGSLLDRTTAMVVAYTVQKTARKLGKTVIIATTHDDMLQDLKPDMWIKKKFGDSVSVTQYQKPEFESECSLLKAARIDPCSLKDIEELEQFHYRGKIRAIVKHCFRATINGELAAGIAYVCPHLSLRGRNIALEEFRGRSDRANAFRVNENILRISRVIVLPKFRSIGLGAEIVRATMPLVKKRYVETLAVMARYNPFFEKAGMVKVEVSDSPRETRDLEGLESLGFRRELLPSRRHTEEIVSKLGKDQLIIARRFALNYCAMAKRRSVALIPGIKQLNRAAISDALRLYSTRPVYLYWKNESWIANMRQTQIRER